MVADVLTQVVFEVCFNMNGQLLENCFFILLTFLVHDNEVSKNETNLTGSPLSFLSPSVCILTLTKSVGLARNWPEAPAVIPETQDFLKHNSSGYSLQITTDLRQSHSQTAANHKAKPPSLFLPKACLNRS